MVVGLLRAGDISGVLESGRGGGEEAVMVSRPGGGGWGGVGQSNQLNNLFRSSARLLAVYRPTASCP